MRRPTVRIGSNEPVDLHLHTIASDGGWQPSQLIDYLANHGFRVAAVSDHDTMRSLPEARARAAERGLTLIPAVEVTSWWGEKQWHILVYGIEAEGTTRFHRLLAEQQANLRAAAENAVRLLEENGHPLPQLEEVVAGRPIMHTYVLQAAIKAGHATNLQTAHELVKQYGEQLKVDWPLAEVVAAAHEAGGVAVIGHPGRPDLGPVLTAERLDLMLAEIPIDGLETHYRSYTDADTARYRAMAEERELLVTSGSDSHAPGVPVYPRPHPARWVAPFLARFGVEVEPFAGEPWRSSPLVVSGDGVQPAGGVLAGAAPPVPTR